MYQYQQYFMTDAALQLSNYLVLIILEKNYKNQLIHTLLYRTTLLY